MADPISALRTAAQPVVAFARGVLPAAAEAAPAAAGATAREADQLAGGLAGAGRPATLGLPGHGAATGAGTTGFQAAMEGDGPRQAVGTAAGLAALRAPVVGPVAGAALTAHSAAQGAGNEQNVFTDACSTATGLSGFVPFAGPAMASAGTAACYGVATASEQMRADETARVEAGTPLAISPTLAGAGGGEAAPVVARFEGGYGR